MESKIPGITDFATTVAVNAAENKIANASDPI